MSVKNPHITMYDLAKACGVSQSTVSRALRNPGKISPATCSKIEKAASELGYVYNYAASSLTVKKTKILGVMHTLRIYLEFGQTISLICRMAAENGYEVVFELTDGSLEWEERAFLRLRQLKVSGVICFDASFNLQDALRREQEKGTPCLMLWQTPAHAGVNFLGADMHKVSHLATNQLLKLGHKRIAFLIAGAFDLAMVRTRWQGYLDALSEAGIAPDEALSHSLLMTPSNSKEPLLQRARLVMDNMLALSEPPTAVVVANSLIGACLLNALKDLRLRVPEDISIMCLHNDLLASTLIPNLSSIDHNIGYTHHELELFLQHIFDGKPVTKPGNATPLTLIMRDSCAPPQM